MLVDGALWHARRSACEPDEEVALHQGDRVIVERLSGLTLCVRARPRPGSWWRMSAAIIAIIVVIAVLVTIAATAAAASVRVLREYERGVVFRLGRLVPTKGPGLVMLVPTIDRMVRVSLRTVTLTVPPQEVITRDNIPARVTAVAYYRVVDSSGGHRGRELPRATLQIAQTTLRSVLGGVVSTLSCWSASGSTRRCSR